MGQEMYVIIRASSHATGALTTVSESDEMGWEPTRKVTNAPFPPPRLLKTLRALPPKLNKYQEEASC